MIIETDSNNPSDVAAVVTQHSEAFVTYDLGDGQRLFVRISDEGLILDLQTPDGEVIATWAAMSDEMAEMTHPLPGTHDPEPRPIPYAATDDMTLGELINIAQERVSGYHQWTKWLDHSYDPAKAALVELLQQYDVVDQKEDTQS